MLYYTILYYIKMYHIILYHIILYDIILYHITLYHIILYYIKLYENMLYLTILSSITAITPHLVVCVYNQRGREEELLGSAQMSISSVLSGSGVGRLQWIQLLHPVGKIDANKDVRYETNLQIKFCSMIFILLRVVCSSLCQSLCLSI